MTPQYNNKKADISTGMFTFAMIRGVKNGWLDTKTYAPSELIALILIIKIAVIKLN